LSAALLAKRFVSLLVGLFHDNGSLSDSSVASNAANCDRHAFALQIKRCRQPRNASADDCDGFHFFARESRNLASPTEHNFFEKNPKAFPKSIGLSGANCDERYTAQENQCCDERQIKNQQHKD
jgi:hypothetical protein